MLRLLTLGRFELIDDAAAATLTRPAATQPKRLALLAYLAASGPGVFHRRDTLVALLWPELGQEEARRALRQALHYLRRHLGEAICTRAHDQVGLTEGCLQSDIADLKRCVAEERHAEVLELYGGPFLEGVHIPDVSTEFEEWTLRTRSRLAELAAQAAWRLSEHEESAGNAAAAVAASRRGYETGAGRRGGIAAAALSAAAAKRPCRCPPGVRDLRRAPRGRIRCHAHAGYDLPHREDPDRCAVGRRRSPCRAGSRSRRDDPFAA